MASSLRRSQIQKQVLSLYKECLRAAEVKSPSFKSVVRNEFKRNGVAIQRTDTMRVEYMLRQGKRRLEMMKVITLQDISETLYCIYLDPKSTGECVIIIRPYIL